MGPCVPGEIFIAHFLQNEGVRLVAPEKPYTNKALIAQIPFTSLHSVPNTTKVK